MRIQSTLGAPSDGHTEEEKRKLKEYGYARKLQGAWRKKKARDRVNKLKAERQRLREEGCALIVQSSWRIRKARKKVQSLRDAFIAHIILVRLV
jgi:hypothetical protein